MGNYSFVPVTEDGPIPTESGSEVLTTQGVFEEVQPQKSVVFDEETLTGAATLENPGRIKEVFVDGVTITGKGYPSAKIAWTGCLTDGETTQGNGKQGSPVVVHPSFRVPVTTDGTYITGNGKTTTITWSGCNTDGVTVLGNGKTDAIHLPEEIMDVIRRMKAFLDRNGG